MYLLENHKVMVAGGAGFVGSAVVRELLKQNIEVVCFDNYLHGTPKNVEQLKGPLTVVQGDILDPWQLGETISHHKIDYIINCVGDTFVPTAYKMPQRFFEINLHGNFNILQAAKTHKVKRVLYVSSTEVYGETNKETIDENTSLNPLNTYAVSKLASDRLCYTFCLEHKIPVIITRIFNCYGPRESQPYIVPEIIFQLHRSNVLYLGNIKAKRDFTYVHDTANALIKVLKSDINNGEVVNIGSGKCYSVEWLVSTLAQIMDISNVEIRQDPKRLRKLDIEKFQCDNSKLKKHTGWFPQIGIEEGLKCTVDWFKKNNNKWSWEDFVKDTIVYR